MSRTSTILAIAGLAMALVESGVIYPVPNHLRDSSYKSAKKMGHGVGYQYAHNFKDHYVEQAYMPEKKTYYEPTEQGEEKRLKERLERLRKPKNG